MSKTKRSKTDLINAAVANGLVKNKTTARGYSVDTLLGLVENYEAEKRAREIGAPLPTPTASFDSHPEVESTAEAITDDGRPVILKPRRVDSGPKSFSSAATTRAEEVDAQRRRRKNNQRKHKRRLGRIRHSNSPTRMTMPSERVAMLGDLRSAAKSISFIPGAFR